ncbi:hypothetical protein MPER_16042, partial [Moniliophthora perniciosa FA553]
MYNDPSCKPWTSRSWAPPGYANRRELVKQTKAAEAHKPLAGGTEERVENHKANPRDAEKGSGPVNHSERSSTLVHDADHEKM